MLTITVGPHKEGICTADGVHMTVVAARISQNGSSVRLGDAEVIGVDDIEIVIQTSEHRISVELTEGTRQAILRFFDVYHKRGNMTFDCYQFANLVHAQPYHRCFSMFRFWDIGTRMEVGPGDTVFLLDMENARFHHAAIYLGYGLFVSIYGGGGDLEFSTLEDMVREFTGSPAVALPRTVS